MAKSEKRPARVMVYISVRDLKDIIRDELYALQSRPDSGLPTELIKEVAKTIVKRALLSPK